MAQSVTDFLAALATRGIEPFIGRERNAKLHIWPRGAFATLTKAERDFLRTHRLALMAELAAIKEATLAREAAALRAAAIRDAELRAAKAAPALPLPRGTAPVARVVRRHPTDWPDFHNPGRAGFVPVRDFREDD